ncbi:Hint domain-containing protein [Maritalea sp.]|uniref:Hint domain-containing protein n=1 Tax=Maritalea sp. TaxID=2003361 RepID=UPI003EF38280
MTGPNKVDFSGGGIYGQVATYYLATGWDGADGQVSIRFGQQVSAGVAASGAGGFDFSFFPYTFDWHVEGAVGVSTPTGMPGPAGGALYDFVSNQTTAFGGLAIWNDWAEGGIYLTVPGNAVTNPSIISDAFLGPLYNGSKYFHSATTTVAEDFFGAPNLEQRLLPGGQNDAAFMYEAIANGWSKEINDLKPYAKVPEEWVENDREFGHFARETVTGIYKAKGYSPVEAAAFARWDATYKAAHLNGLTGELSNSPVGQKHSLFSGPQMTVVTAEYAEALRDLKALGLTPPDPNQVSVFCFSGDTHITMSDGSRKPIADIVVGDEVLAFSEFEDGGRGGLVPRRVVNLFRSLTDEWLELSNGVTVTAGHHFLTVDGSFAPISEILEMRDGMVVLEDGSVERLTGKRVAFSEETAGNYPVASEWVAGSDGALVSKLVRNGSRWAN